MPRRRSARRHVRRGARRRGFFKREGARRRRRRRRSPGDAEPRGAAVAAAVPDVAVAEARARPGALVRDRPLARRPRAAARARGRGPARHRDVPGEGSGGEVAGAVPRRRRGPARARRRPSGPRVRPERPDVARPRRRGADRHGLGVLRAVRRAQARVRARERPLRVARPAVRRRRGDVSVSGRPSGRSCPSVLDLRSPSRGRRTQSNAAKSQQQMYRCGSASAGIARPRN